MNEIKESHFIGAGINPSNTIQITGKGEVFAAPDIANISFSVTKEAKTVKDAQAQVSVLVDKTLIFLKDSNIAERDIKTEGYSSYPKYDYKYDNDVYCGAYTCPPRPTNPVIIGYEVSQNISLKIRKIDDVGKILEGLGKIGMTNMQGPDFSIDNEDKIRDEARQKAIKDAKEKAETLARDLGIRLVRIVSFNESGDFPIYYAKAELMSADSGGAAAPSPELPIGENKIISNVTITYEIR